MVLYRNLGPNIPIPVLNLSESDWPHHDMSSNVTMLKIERHFISIVQGTDMSWQIMKYKWLHLIQRVKCYRFDTARLGSEYVHYTLSDYRLSYNSTDYIWTRLIDTLWVYKFNLMLRRYLIGIQICPHHLWSVNAPYSIHVFFFQIQSKELQFNIDLGKYFHFLSSTLLWTMADFVLKTFVLYWVSLKADR